MKTQKFIQNKNGEFYWLFDWADGGFNSAWGKTKASALRDIAKQFSGNPKVVNLRKATEKTSAEQDRLGRMMTC